MITSAQNPKIQWVRKLQSQVKERRRENMFVAEGVRLLEEAYQSDWEPALVLHTHPLSERGQVLTEAWQAAGITVEEVSENVLAAASDTQTPQGILAVFKMRRIPLPPEPDFLLIADSIRDPGNMGTILRTALAAGVQGVLLPVGSVDPWSPKVVRSAMGAHFRLSVNVMTWTEISSIVHPETGKKLQVLIADSGSGLAHTVADLMRPLALVIGGEAYGAGAPASELADGRIHIAMPGGVESLNAAIAAAVLLFEVARQRNSPPSC